MGDSSKFKITLFQVALAGSVVIGAGSLAYYGLGLSQAPGAVDKALAWPQHVRDRVRLTYSYLIASVGVTAAFAMAILRLPVATYFTVYFSQTGSLCPLGSIPGHRRTSRYAYCCDLRCWPQYLLPARLSCCNQSECIKFVHVWRHYSGKSPRVLRTI